MDKRIFKKIEWNLTPENTYQNVYLGTIDELLIFKIYQIKEDVDNCFLATYLPFNFRMKRGNIEWCKRKANNTLKAFVDIILV